MEKLKNLVQEVLDSTMFEAECVMRSDRNENITVITDNLGQPKNLTTMLNARS